MTGPEASPRGQRHGFLLPLSKEASGRYRASSDAIGTASDPLLQDALRELLDRHGSAESGVAEIAGRLYETRLLIPASDPGTAYAETDADCVPLDTPAAAPIQPQFPAYIASLRERCSVSDALTPDTSIPLAAAFIPPAFVPIGQGLAEPVTFGELGGFPRIVITGPPGAGKTSTIRRLALDLTADGAAPADTLPILIQLRNLTADDFAADGLLRLITAGTGPGLAAELRPPMSGGRLVLLIDGLDELSGPEEQEQLLDRLASLCRAEARRIRVVLTTRDPVSLHALDDFTQLRIEPFNTSQIHQWTRHYLRIHDPGHSRWAEFLDLLHYDGRFRELVSNPLLLGLASSLHWKYPDELNSRAGLLRKCIDVLIQDWDAARGIARWRASEVTPRQIKRVLNRLSAPLKQESHDSFTVDQADQEVAGLTGFREPGATLLWASQTSGLVTEADGRYRFAHASVAEYFGASDVVRRTEPVSEMIREASQREDGSNFWRLACALTSDADLLLRGVLRYAAKDDRAAAFMMAQALGEEVSASVTVIERCSQHVVTALEARLGAAEPLAEDDARQPWSLGADRSVVWADGVAVPHGPDVAGDLLTSAQLLELIFRARTGSSRDYVRYFLEESAVPLLRNAAAALKFDGWLDYTVRQAGDQTLLYVAVTQSAAPEARRMVTRPPLLSQEPPPDADQR